MKNLPQNWRIIFGITAIVMLICLLWLFRMVIAYVVIAIVIAFICDPIVELLRKIRFRNLILPSWFRALTSLGVFIGVFVLLVAVFMPLVNEEIAILSAIDAKQMAIDLQQRFHSDDSAISNYFSGLSVTEYLFAGLQSIFSPEAIQGVFNSLFGFIGNVVIGLFAVLFIAFFFLKDGYLFARIVFTITPTRHFEGMKNIMEHTHRLLRKYFIGVALQSLIMAFMVGIALSLLGVSNAVLIGLFAGLVNVIPYLGPMMGASFGIFIALSTSLHLDMDAAVLPLLVKVSFVFLGAQLIDAFVVQPVVLGNSVKAHPLEIFIVILMAGTIGGVIGMVLAIPVYTILRVVAREFLSEFRVVDSLTRELSNRE